MSDGVALRDGLPVGFQRSYDPLETITFEVREGGIGWLELARPDKLNAFNERMIAEIRSIVWRANFDDSIRVLVITGQGRGFCAGRDIVGLQYENNLSTAQYRAYVRSNHEMFDDLEAIEKPVIAAVNGICAGGGVEMAISCDIRLVSAAGRFLLPENQLGVIPAAGASSRMIQMIGIGRLKEMMMLAEPVDAAEAHRIGLANRVFPADGFEAAVMAYAGRLLTKAPLAMGMAKHMVNLCQNADTETGRNLERLGQSILIRSEDAQDGMQAFRDKRPPAFRGR